MYLLRKAADVDSSVANIVEPFEIWVPTTVVYSVQKTSAFRSRPRRKTSLQTSLKNRTLRTPPPRALPLSALTRKLKLHRLWHMASWYASKHDAGYRLL